VRSAAWGSPRRWGRYVAAVLAAVASAVASAGLLAGCSGAQRGAGPGGRVVFSTGSPVGVYYAWGSALADELSPRGIAVTVSTSTGSVENLRRVRDGSATMALTTLDAAQDARADADGDAGVVALARVYDDYLHLVVRRDGPVGSLGELAGRRVAVGASGSGTALVAQRVLRIAGVRVRAQPLDLAAGVAALRAGSVDALFWSGGVPTAAISELATTVPIRLLPLDGAAEPMRARYAGVYRPAVMPPGAYGSAEPVAGLASANLLVTRPDAQDEVVRTVLAAMFGRRAQLARRVPAARALDVRTAIFTGTLPLHPAAAAYYRELKR
jgi:uncharacterized protein